MSRLNSTVRCVLRRAVLRAQRAMAFERVNRRIGVAKVQARVREVEENRPAQADRRRGRHETIRPQQHAMRAADVAAGRHRMHRLDDRRARDDQRLLRRLRGRDRPRDVTAGDVHVAAQPELVGEVLPRDDLALGFARSGEPLGRRFVERDGLGALQLVEPDVREHERRPRMLGVAGSHRSKPADDLVAHVVGRAHLAQAHQVVVRSSADRLEVRRPRTAAPHRRGGDERGVTTRHRPGETHERRAQCAPRVRRTSAREQP